MLQDTPGYGDDLDIMNHINMINGHINSCNEKWLQLESARDRAQDLAEVRTADRRAAQGKGMTRRSGVQQLSACCRLQHLSSWRSITGVAHILVWAAMLRSHYVASVLAVLAAMCPNVCVLVVVV